MFDEKQAGSQDNIYEECLAEVAKLTLARRQTVAGSSMIAQAELEEWNVAKAAAEFSKRKTQANLIRAQRNSVEARVNLEEAKRNARDAARDTLYATTAANDVLLVKEGIARARAEERAAKVKAEKELADQERAKAVAKEKVEAAFSYANTTNTKVAWEAFQIAVKNFTVEHSSDQDFFREKEKIADKKIDFLRLKNRFVEVVKAARDSFANIRKKGYDNKVFHKERVEFERSIYHYFQSDDRIRGALLDAVSSIDFNLKTGIEMDKMA